MPKKLVEIFPKYMLKKGKKNQEPIKVRCSSSALTSIINRSIGAAYTRPRMWQKEGNKGIRGEER
jgi:hypothetical protein